MTKILAVLCFCLLSAGACVRGPAYEASSGLIFVGTFMVFYDSQGPLSYQTMTPQEVPEDAVLVGEVEGESCQHGLSIPIFFSLTERISVSGAKGDGGYKKALRDIRQKHPDLAGLYDVKVDFRRMSILTIYRKLCTIVVARGFTRPHLDDATVLSSE